MTISFSPRRWRATGIAAVAVLALAGCTSSQALDEASAVLSASPAKPPATESAASSAPATDTPLSWPGYHATLTRTGAVRSSASFAYAHIAWADDLGGVVHGQAVAAQGRIVAATERNRVVALDPANGKILWSRSLGRPLTDVVRVAGCGDIDPLGITSTPVIDTKTGTVFVVGEISDGHGGVTHRLEGFALSNGRVRLSEVVDPPLPRGETALHLLQRPGLAVANGRVYIAYGGNDGDCGEYHGWVVGVNETGPAHELAFEVASNGQGGAVWESGGAPAIDRSGDVYVTTGNANPDPPKGGPDSKKYTESVVKLSPTLTPLASYKDRIAGGDEDLATGNPVLLPGGLIFAVGKTDVGYLLRQSNLSHVASIPNVCGSAPDGGPAFYAKANRIYVPCRDGGIQAIVLHGSGGRLAAKLTGSDSAPIVINSSLWSLNHLTGVLHAYNAADGTRRQKVATRASVPIFSSPSTAFGLLLISTSTGVTALR